MSAEITLFPSESSPNQNPDPPYEYDRDAIIKRITQYYELLSKMISIKPKHIEYPPETGWEDDTIPIDKLRRLGFNDRVIDFIRHLPIAGSTWRETFPCTTTIYYTHYGLNSYPLPSYQLNDPHAVELWPYPDQRIPEGVVPLSYAFQCHPSATWWILDTNNGELTAYDGWHSRPEEEIPEGEEWRSTRPVLATQYFDGLCEKLRGLEMIPVPAGKEGMPVWEIWYAKGMEWNQKWEAKAIYLQCRWPDLARFKRQKCRTLLVEMMDRREVEQREK